MNENESCIACLFGYMNYPLWTHFVRVLCILIRAAVHDMALANLNGIITCKANLEKAESLCSPILNSNCYIFIYIACGLFICINSENQLVFHVLGRFYKCLPAMLIQSVGGRQLWRWWANMLLIYFLIVKQPAYSSHCFVYICRLCRWKEFEF